MKSNSPESALFRDAGLPDRNRRSLAEATSQLGQAVGEALTGALGGRRHVSGGRSSESSAAMSTHRLREVLERDRALVAAQQTAAEEAARVQKARAPVRVPPPPPPSRKPASGARVVEDRSLLDALIDDDHDDDALSVHDEPTRVGPPPALQAEPPHSGQLSASAAAAASAFGSASGAVSCGAASAARVVTGAEAADTRAGDAATRAADAAPKSNKASANKAGASKAGASKAGASKAAKSKPAAPKASADKPASPPSRTSGVAPASVHEAARATPATQAISDEDTSLLPREPIRTLTMARLLASQGHLRRALSIYDELLIKTPSDLGLRTETETLRALLD